MMIGRATLTVVAPTSCAMLAIGPARAAPLRIDPAAVTLAARATPQRLVSRNTLIVTVPLSARAGP